MSLGWLVKATILLLWWEPYFNSTIVLFDNKEKYKKHLCNQSSHLRKFWLNRCIILKSEVATLQSCSISKKKHELQSIQSSLEVLMESSIDYDYTEPWSRQSTSVSVMFCWLHRYYFFFVIAYCMMHQSWLMCSQLWGFLSTVSFSLLQLLYLVVGDK